MYYVTKTSIIMNFFKRRNKNKRTIEEQNKVNREYWKKNNVDIVEVPIRYEARSYQDGKKIKLKDGIIIFLKILKYSKLNIFN